MNYRHNPNIVITELEDELVLLDPSSKQMFSLNAVGRLLWDQLPSLGLTGVLERIEATFEVGADRARTDAMALIENLVRANLLVETRSPEPDEVAGDRESGQA
jgi:hypothetical protein